MIGRPVMRTVGRTAVIAGTATAVSGRVARRQEMRYEQKDADAYYAAQEAEPAQAPPAPQPAAGPSPDDITRLQQLGALKSQGVLTEEEFAAEKAKILNS